MESPFWAEGPSFFTGVAPNYGGQGGPNSYSAQYPQADQGRQEPPAQSNGYPAQGAVDRGSQAVVAPGSAHPVQARPAGPPVSAGNTGEATVAQPRIGGNAFADSYWRNHAVPVYTVSKQKPRAVGASNVFGPTWW